MSSGCWSTLRVSPKRLPLELIPPNRTVVLRPASLIAGIGASSGAPRAEIDALLQQAVEALTKGLVNKLNENGNYPLTSAAEKGHVEIVKILLDAHLVQRRRAGRSVLYYRTAAGDTLLEAQQGR